MKTEQAERIQKIIAQRDEVSRREAEHWIAEGRVLVNGNPVSLGDKCLPSSDTITVDGRVLPCSAPRKVVIALNKPRGYLCSNRDPHGGKTVFDLIPPDLNPQGLSCVGRLDKDSEGLLLLTNDGQLKQQLTHPSYGIVKKYAVELNKPLDPGDVRKLLKGIQWEGEPLSVDKVFPFKRNRRENWKELEVTLHHGKKREIRRLFYAFGYNVKRLKRYQIGGFQLKGIPRGAFRILNRREIRQLRELFD